MTLEELQPFLGLRAPMDISCCVNTTEASMRFKAGDKVRLLPLEKLLIHPSISSVKWIPERNSVEAYITNAYSFILPLEYNIDITLGLTRAIRIDNGVGERIDEYFYNIGNKTGNYTHEWVNDWMVEPIKNVNAQKIAFARRIAN